MWLLFHRKAGTKVVAGGETLTERCPTCEKTTRFEEVETSESYGLFYVVDIVSDKQRAFRCRVCGDTFELRDEPDEQPPPRARQQALADRTEALAAEQRRRDAEKAARATRIEDELAELKKRLGK
jgi:hypothetical protein